MAVLVSRQSGNFTNVSTWKQVATGTRAVQAVISASTSVTTSAVYNADAQDFTIANGLVIEGVMLYCGRLSTTGTVTISLSDNSGTSAIRTVTVNASDIPQSPTWVFFKFATTLTGDGGTDYAIGVQGSTAGNSTFFRNGTADWARLIVLNTNPASVAAGDNFHIVGELTGAGAGSDFTVTMNSTAATDYGTNTTLTTNNGVDIGNRGILTYGTDASTNYILRLSGRLNVWGGGTFNMGTSGTPMPRSSTALLEFDSTSAGQFGINVTGTFNAWGLSRTSGKDVVFARLTADEAAGATTIDVDTDTGWLSGDAVCFAPTGTTPSQFETKNLSADAGASSFTLSAGLTFAHLGTAPRNAEVGLLTRNVRIQAVNTTFGYFFTSSVGMISSTIINLDWVSLRDLNSAVFISAIGSYRIRYCSFFNGKAGAIQITGNQNWLDLSIENNIFYNMCLTTGFSVLYMGANIQDPTGTIAINNLMICGATSTNSIGFTLSYAITCPIFNIYISGIMSVSGKGFRIEYIAWNLSSHRISNMELHAIQPTLNTYDAALSTTADSISGVIFENLKIYDCTQAFGRNTSSPFSTNSKLSFLNSTFQNTSNDIFMATHAQLLQVTLENCLLGGTTEVSNFNLVRGSDLEPSFIKSTRHDQQDGNHRTWCREGIISSDTVIFRTASPSERLTPVLSTRKLVSGSKFVAVESGQTVNIAAYVRESVAGDGTDYNGARIRLILRRNYVMGITDDTVIATATVSSEGAWEQISGTTSAAPRDGVLEFYIDCDGTTGWVNVDDWSAA